MLKITILLLSLKASCAVPVAHGTPKNADDFAPLEAPACARKSPFENVDFYKNWGVCVKNA
jgi:hypothetical protein